jgi:hypothetical protein
MLMVLLPLVTYLFFGIIFECAEFITEFTVTDTDKFTSWKALKFLLPAIPTVAVLRGLLAGKTRKA